MTPRHRTALRKNAWSSLTCELEETDGDGLAKLFPQPEAGSETAVPRSYVLDVFLQQVAHDGIRLDTVQRSLEHCRDVGELSGHCPDLGSASNPRHSALMMSRDRFNAT